MCGWPLLRVESGFENRRPGAAGASDLGGRQCGPKSGGGSDVNFYIVIVKIDKIGKIIEIGKIGIISNICNIVKIGN